MKSAMKNFLLTACGLILFATLNASATAQGYPTKAVKLVVPYPPGGSADMLARTLAGKLGSALGQPFVVENKPGAGTALGARDVAGSAGDGYTLMMGTVTSHAMNPALNPAIGYDPIKDFVAIAPVSSIPFALVVHPDVPARTFAEFIALAKQQPGKMTYASAGVGTSNHLAGELLKVVAGVDLLHVPFKGSAPALSNVLAGHVSTMFDLVLTASKQVQAGAVRALAVTSKARSPLMPDVPTFADVGLPDFDVTAWFGIFAPAGVPPDVVKILNTEIGKAVQSPDTLDQLKGVGAEALSGSSAEFSAVVQADLSKWRKVIQESGIKMEQ